MEKNVLESLIEEGLSTRGIAERLNKSQSSVKYWLKKYNLKTILVNDSSKKKCCECKFVKDKSEFYKKTGDTLQPYCKPCLLKKQKNRWVKRKIDAIISKGSECVDCGLSYPEEPYCIFDFHHLDPSIKEYSWDKMRLMSKDKMLRELDKCVLLCSNCHRKRHI